MYTFTFSGKRNQFGEYVVKCYKGGKRFPNSDYFTNDKDDAINTKKEMEEQSKFLMKHIGSL